VCLVTRSPVREQAAGNLQRVAEPYPAVCQVNNRKPQLLRGCKVGVCWCSCRRCNWGPKRFAKAVAALRLQLCPLCYYVTQQHHMFVCLCVLHAWGSWYELGRISVVLVTLTESGVDAVVHKVAAQQGSLWRVDLTLTRWHNRVEGSLDVAGGASTPCLPCIKGSCA
jgi:hypothetical protein